MSHHFRCSLNYSLSCFELDYDSSMINRLGDPGDILKSDSFPSRMMRIYMRMIGSTYLKDTLGPIMKDFISSGTFFLFFISAKFYFFFSSFRNFD